MFAVPIKYHTLFLKLCYIVDEYRKDTNKHDSWIDDEIKKEITKIYPNDVESICDKLFFYYTRTKKL